MRSVILAVALAVAPTAAAADSNAEPPAADHRVPTPREHGGVYFRGQFGTAVFGGFGSASTHTAVGAGVSLALGGSLNRWLALYGEATAIGSVQIFGPSFSVTSIGPGATLWLPHDVYISATALAMKLSQSQWIPNSMGSSGREWGAIGRGYGASMAIGKEWHGPREGKRLTAGIALRAFIGKLDCTSACYAATEMPVATWKLRGGLFVFSTTFN